MPTPLLRCPWADGSESYAAYHDHEWGVPVHDDRTLFEFLILEGAQAGLSWDTILQKRENYRKAFDGFEVKRVARYDARRVRTLMNDAGIVRNRLKIASAVQSNDLVTIFWLGRTANAEAFGRAWDAWRTELSNKKSVASKLNERFGKCTENMGRRGFDLL